MNMQRQTSDATTLFLTFYSAYDRVSPRSACSSHSEMLLRLYQQSLLHIVLIMKVVSCLKISRSCPRCYQLQSISGRADWHIWNLALKKFLYSDQKLYREIIRPVLPYLMRLSCIRHASLPRRAVLAAPCSCSWKARQMSMAQLETYRSTTLARP